MAAPPPVDFDHPNPARVYDLLLGNGPGFAPDRALADLLCDPVRGHPDLAGRVREGRKFLTGACRWLAAMRGVTQFIDLGAGLQVRPSLRDAAAMAGVQPKVAYVDYDPVVCGHLRAACAGMPGIAVIEADVTDLASVLGDPALRDVIDMAGPVCVILGLVLSLMPARQARQVVAGYADLIAPGSYVVISCGRCGDEVLWKQLSEAYTAADVWNHSLADLEGFLAGLEPVPPGIVPAPNWRGGRHDVPLTPPGPAYVLAGVARKP